MTSGCRWALDVTSNGRERSASPNRRPPGGRRFAGDGRHGSGVHRASDERKVERVSLRSGTGRMGRTDPAGVFKRWRWALGSCSSWRPSTFPVSCWRVPRHGNARSPFAPPLAAGAHSSLDCCSPRACSWRFSEARSVFSLAFVSVRAPAGSRHDAGPDGSWEIHGVSPARRSHDRHSRSWRSRS